MLGNMMVELNRKILKSYVKLGERLGHWSSLDQTYIDSKGRTGRRLYADWLIPTEEYEQTTRSISR